MFRLKRKYEFHAARKLTALNENHPCGELHGHTFAITIKVTGDNSKGQDDYFVKFSQDTSNGQYIWKETVAPGVLTRINKATMPHTIKYFGSSGYTFDAETYADRGVGDDDTNPFPSFVGQKINDVFFYRNRLGFLADENVIFSQAGEFFNFFNKTVLIGVDIAPIDVAV